jgi:uracil phosphoribosyltransferase
MFDRGKMLVRRFGDGHFGGVRCTGGTLVKVLEDIISRGASPSMIRVVTVVCAPAALTKLSEGFPGALLQLRFLSRARR